MVCPYSLSVPGGVQAQVMGLSRELRKMGIEVRVLAPCDGPPPATFVTPLGNSLPTSANGSMAPLAPDPSCSLRTMRALGDEQFDVLHLHEPFIPGPTQTAMLLHPAPVVATFHAAGESASYKYLRADDQAGGQPTSPTRSPSRRTPQSWCAGTSAATTRSCTTASSSTPIATRRRPPDDRSDDLLLRPPRGAQGARCAAGRGAGSSAPRCASGSAAPGPTPRACRLQYADDPRIEWLGRLTDADKMARLRGADVFCAPSLHGESFGVVLIEAMAAETAIVASGLDGYRNVATDDVDAVLVEPGDVERPCRLP